MVLRNKITPPLCLQYDSEAKRSVLGVSHMSFLLEPGVIQMTDSDRLAGQQAHGLSTSLALG